MTDKLAVQLFTVREFTRTAKEFAETLRRIREIGYTAVQVSAVGAMNGDAPEVDAALARRMLDDHGLTCIATHRPWDNLRDHTEAEIEFHQTLGCDFAAIGGIGTQIPENVQRYRDFLQEARSVIATLKAAGIRFAHHNHSHEFFRTERGGPCPEDILIDEGGDDLFLELDLYWIEHAGFNCARILERCHGRVPVVHIKDKEVIEGKNDTRMAPIGEGNLDWDGIISAGAAAGVRWYAVEQDKCYRDPFDCLKSSYDFLRSKGL
ncbi:MAG: sugar phosphate isomerase/epimerase [Verrucomicrobia bacterium]|nr:sugar phosphate isomerase/epimerase [Verrucomicrobiota bacterium]MCH8526629.1 sugar phosphate isomerase/epimerase [Kiritimatiellia bacterium]